MEITKTLHVIKRSEWRQWLKRNHKREPEIWLAYHRRDSGKPRLSYNDAVEEALCFGWIDGIEKKLNSEASAQRFTPRRPNSNRSQLNRERARQMINLGLMTEAGFAALGNVLESDFEMPTDILKALKADQQTWENFQHFSETYRRIRIGYIEEVRKRPAEFQKRLANFLKKTAENKRFGTIT